MPFNVPHYSNNACLEASKIAKIKMYLRFEVVCNCINCHSSFCYVCRSAYLCCACCRVSANNYFKKVVFIIVSPMGIFSSTIIFHILKMAKEKIKNVVEEKVCYPSRFIISLAVFSCGPQFNILNSVFFWRKMPEYVFSIAKR